MLLLHLIGKLEVALWDILHLLLLYGIAAARSQVLGGGNHAHVDILLVGSLDLLLLLLKQFDLLLNSKLLHCRSTSQQISDAKSLELR